MFKAVLFDFDGTLAQLTIDFAEMRSLALNELAHILDCTPEKVTRPMPVMENIELLCAENPHLAETIRGRTEKVISDFEVEAAANCTLFPFTLPLLEKLCAAGIKTGIVTRNCRAAIEKVFPDYHNYCGALVDRGGVAPHFLKPHPEHLLTALRLIECEPQDSLMVGDHPMDINSGKAAGCATGAVLTGHADRAKLEAAKPDYLTENTFELFKLIGL